MISREIHPEVDIESRKKFILRSFVILSIWLVLPLIWLIISVYFHWDIYYSIGLMFVIVACFFYIFIFDVLSDKKQIYKVTENGLIVKDFWGNKLEIEYSNILKLSKVRPDLKKQFLGIRSESSRHYSKYPVRIIPGKFYHNMFVVTLKRPMHVHTKSSHYSTEIFYLGDDREKSAYDLLKKKISYY